MISTVLVETNQGGDFVLDMLKPLPRNVKIINITEHAPKKHRIRQMLDYDERGGELTVEDDGKGFPTDRRDDREGGNGLRIMRHRAEVFGGELAVGPGPAGGVQVRCRFPKA